MEPARGLTLASARWRLWALGRSCSSRSSSALRRDRLLARRSDRDEPAAGGRVRRPPRPVQARARSGSGSRTRKDDLTIASVTVDDAIVPFRLDGPAELGRLRSSTIVIPYDWVQDDPITVGVTSSTGIETVEEIPGRGRDTGAAARAFLGYAIIGFLVGVLPIALGLLWLPSLGAPTRSWLAAFMALTAGPAHLPRRRGPLGGVRAPGRAAGARSAAPGSCSRRRHELPDDDLSRPPHARRRGGALSGLGLATLVAIGIGLHNLGEGLAIGTSFAFGQLTLGTFLIVGFMIHNVTEGLGIAAPVADDRTQHGLVPATRRTRPDRRRPGDPRRLARRLRLQRPARGRLLRSRGRSCARSRRRGRPLRRAPSPRRSHLRLRRRRLHGRHRRHVRDRPARRLTRRDPRAFAPCVFWPTVVGSRYSTSDY